MVRFLTVNDEVTIPGTVVCIDVASVGEVDKLNPNRTIERLRCWSAVAARMEAGKWTREKSSCGSDQNSLWQWINFVRHSGKPLWLFAYNLAMTLTISGLWKLMTAGEFGLNKLPKADLTHVRSDRLRRQLSRVQPGLLIDTDPPTAVICFHKTGWKLHCIDLRNYTSHSMSTIAGLFSMPLTRSPSDSAPLANWYEYCAERAKLVAECVRLLAVWHKEQELGRFGMTTAGIAMAGFRHRFMHHDIELPDEQDTRDFQRLAYYNGRTQPFWVGEIRSNRYIPHPGARRSPTLFDAAPRGPFHLVDARSFYAAVESFSEIPAAQIGEGDNSLELDFPPDIEDGSYLATVTIASRREIFPVRFADRTIFATGRFQTTLCGPELQRAITTNSVAAMGRWQRFRLGLVLKPYADALYAERQKAEQAGNQWIAHVCKGLMACMHGKFLQHATRWTNCPKLVAPDAWTRWYHLTDDGQRTDRFRSIGWSVQRMEDAGDAPHCFPAIAAWVTAIGREWLRTWIGFAGEKNVLYCSTDSLIVTEKGRVNLEQRGLFDSTHVGSLRVQATADQIDVRGSNNITFGTTATVSGLPEGSAEVDRGRWLCRNRSSLGAAFALAGADFTTSTQTVQLLPRSTIDGTVTDGGWIEPPILKMEQPIQEPLQCPVS